MKIGIFCIFVSKKFLSRTGKDNDIVDLSVCYLFKTFRKLGGGKNKSGIKSECPRYAWAFGLS